MKPTIFVATKDALATLTPTRDGVYCIENRKVYALIASNAMPNGENIIASSLTGSVWYTAELETGGLSIRNLGPSTSHVHGGFYTVPLVSEISVHMETSFLSITPEVQGYANTTVTVKVEGGGTITCLIKHAESIFLTKEPSGQWYVRLGGSQTTSLLINGTLALPNVNTRTYVDDYLGDTGQPARVLKIYNDSIVDFTLINTTTGYQLYVTRSKDSNENLRVTASTRGRDHLTGTTLVRDITLNVVTTNNSTGSMSDRIKSPMAQAICSVFVYSTDTGKLLADYTIMMASTNTVSPAKITIKTQRTATY